MEQIENDVRNLLMSLGQNINREGLVGTPSRVARVYFDMMNPEPFNFTTFDSEGMSEMVVQTNIPMYSLYNLSLIHI